MTKEEIKSTIFSATPEIRSRLISALHNEAKDEYINRYKLENGKEPDKDNIIMFDQILIAGKAAAKDADSIINELVDGIYVEQEKENKNRRLLLGVVNTIILAMLLSLSINFIFLYLRSIGCNIFGTYDPLTFVNCANAFVVTIMTITYYIFTIFNKK